MCLETCSSTALVSGHLSTPCNPTHTRQGTHIWGVPWGLHGALCSRDHAAFPGVPHVWAVPFPQWVPALVILSFKGGCQHSFGAGQIVSFHIGDKHGTRRSELDFPLTSPSPGRMLCTNTRDVPAVSILFHGIN